MQIILPLWQALGEAQCDVDCGPLHSPVLQQMPLHAFIKLECRHGPPRPPPPPPPTLKSSWCVSRTRVRFYLSLAKILRAASSWERQIAETWLRARISQTWSGNVPNLTFVWLRTPSLRPSYQCVRQNIYINSHAVFRIKNHHLLWFGIRNCVPELLFSLEVQRQTIAMPWLVALHLPYLLNIQTSALQNLNYNVI
jgi:hypothetical protein